MTAAPVYLIGGGPGAYDLITLRGLRALERAQVILVDNLGPGKELAKLISLENKEIIDCAKIPYGKQVSQQKIMQIMLEKSQQGLIVARLKGGDPFIFGRGYEELVFLRSHNIAVEVIPGLTSPVAVSTLAQIPLTHRGLVHNFTVVSGHLAPEDPQNLTNFSALAKLNSTIVLIMAVKNAAKIAQKLITEGLDPKTACQIIEHGSQPQERRFKTALSGLGELIAAEKVLAPAIIIIGKVADIA